MAFAITVEPDLLRIALTGALTAEDLAGLATATDDLERGRDPVPARLTDMTGVTTVEIFYPDVKTLADHRRTLQFPNAFRSAIVVRTPVQRGMARMFQTLNDNPQITIEIFDDEAAALAWIRG
ncbi:MAG TPA: STAS/SEC14 domain-containing protein [Candidatus Eisenbacteria bacterium]|nr:STAS/SEC14 domain-containing protein [Candidatus Eisenbacteria bacterium]